MAVRAHTVTVGDAPERAAFQSSALPKPWATSVTPSESDSLPGTSAVILAAMSALTAGNEIPIMRVWQIAPVYSGHAHPLHQVCTWEDMVAVPAVLASPTLHCTH